MRGRGFDRPAFPGARTGRRVRAASVSWSGRSVTERSRDFQRSRDSMKRRPRLFALLASSSLHLSRPSAEQRFEKPPSPEFQARGLGRLGPRGRGLERPRTDERREDAPKGRFESRWRIEDRGGFSKPGGFSKRPADFRRSRAARAVSATEASPAAAKRLKAFGRSEASRATGMLKRG